MIITLILSKHKTPGRSPAKGFYIANGKIRAGVSGQRSTLEGNRESWAARAVSNNLYIVGPPVAP